MRKVIRPPITACPACSASYDARELAQLRPVKEQKDDGILRFHCADCSDGIVAIDRELALESVELVVDADDYAERFPNHVPRRAFWVTEKGNPVPPWLAWVATTKDRRLFLVAFLLLLAVTKPEWVAAAFEWVEANW